MAGKPGAVSRLSNERNTEHLVSDLEYELATQISLMGLPEPMREFKFHPTRKWRFDLAWPELMIALEVEGGTWISGAHVRGAHYSKDCEKYNNATQMGWKVYRVTTEMIHSGEAANFVEMALNG
jgi:hypothetical protein